MCTAFTLQNESLYFGRNMDIEYSFKERVVITPREFVISTKCMGNLNEHYAIIGMANVTDNYPLYAEAVNENGLCMAGLNFPENAKYISEEKSSKKMLTPYELILYTLGSCKNLSEAKNLLKDIDIVNIPFIPSLSLAPLHWIVSDKSGSITVEYTKTGMNIYDNPYGVLTNNPPFEFHCENVRQYIHLSTGYAQNKFSDSLELIPFCQGAAAFGLPGDCSSASRFIKTLFCKMNSVCENNEESYVSQVFHILDSVAMIQGTVITSEEKEDITRYSCCINASEGIYYYKTYWNNQITKITLTEKRKQESDLILFELNTKQQFIVE